MRLVLPAAAVFGLAASSAGGGIAGADPEQDFARAKSLYTKAETEMKNGNFGDAAHDYAAAYELTSDPVLFFKIGSANDKAGQCLIAIQYFKRYLAEAHPDAHWVAIAKERIESCGGVVDAGSAGSSAAGSAAEGSAVGDSGSGSGSGSGMSDTVAVPPPAHVEHGHGRNGAWIATASSVALLTTGVVLAFASSSSENDIKDLYQPVGNGPPPQFDQATQKRYQQLLDEGHRYEYLSWTSFGLAVAAGGIAAYLFAHDDSTEHVVTPMLTPQSAGAAATFRF